MLPGPVAAEGQRCFLGSVVAVLRVPGGAFPAIIGVEATAERFCAIMIFTIDRRLNQGSWIDYGMGVIA